ncbi:MAG: hypothetical protein K2I89_10195, partial [Muribaculaceae bacterium]|nr:hypothetical protein [Muribaculaceae bacterium]
MTLVAIHRYIMKLILKMILRISTILVVSIFIFVMCMANPISPNMSISVENENIQDKEILEPSCTDTIKFELPYANITNRKLKRIIDSFKIT